MVVYVHASLRHRLWSHEIFPPGGIPRRTVFRRSKFGQRFAASQNSCSWRFFRARRAGSHKHDAHRNAPYSRHPLVSARFARGGVTHPRARREARGVPPRTGALPSAVGASQADSPVGPGVRIICDMTSHDKVRRESLRCSEALFTRREARTNARGDARARPVSAPAHRRFAKALR